MTPRQFLLLGRCSFGVAMVGFAALSLLHLDFVNSLQPVPEGLPGYRGLAALSGMLLGVAGAAIVIGRRIGTAASVLLGFLVSWIVLLHIPSAFHQPSLLRSPWWIRTFETLTFAGAALILATSADSSAPRQRIEWARIAIGLSLPVFGVLHLIYPASVAALVPPWYPLPMFWAYFTGLAQIAAGLALATRVFPRLAAAMAGLMYGVFAVTLHMPRNWCRLAGPCELLPNVPVTGFGGIRPEMTSMFVAIGMCGAAWILAGSLSSDSDRRGGVLSTAR